VATDPPSAAPEVSRALSAGLATLNLAGADRERKLLELVNLLAEWNARFNLTAITEPLAVVRKHVLDSLTVQPWVHGPRVLDLGTGAGFPGLPLAIVNPTLEFVLLDSTAKKLAFVREAARALALENVAAVHARAERYSGPRAATVIARAVGDLSRLCGWSERLLAPGGSLVAMKGRYPARELKAIPKGWLAVLVQKVAVPELADARHVVVLERAVS
jgi:16S rRNA (guanine527-N7)-methyltransferase